MISEVGARPPGAQITSLISYAHDVDFYRAWARLVVFDQFDPPPRRYAAGCAYLRGQGRGTIRAIHGLAEVLERDLGGIVVEIENADDRSGAVVELRGRRLRHRPPPGDRGGRRGAAHASSSNVRVELG